MRVPGPGLDPSKRTDIHDAAMRGTQVRQCLACNEKGTTGVGLKNGVPLVKGERVERGGPKDSGVVDDQIEAAVKGSSGCHGVMDRHFRAYVARDGLCASTECLKIAYGRGSLFFGVTPGDGDGSSGLSERQGNCPADTACTTSDKRRFTFEFKPRGQDGLYWG